MWWNVSIVTLSRLGNSLSKAKAKEQFIRHMLNKISNVSLYQLNRFLSSPLFILGRKMEPVGSAVSVAAAFGGCLASVGYCLSI